MLIIVFKTVRSAYVHDSTGTNFMSLVVLSFSLTISPIPDAERAYPLSLSDVCPNVSDRQIQ